MSCPKCNKHACECIPEGCMTCKIELPVECIRWHGEPIPELNIKHGERLDSIITKIVNAIKELQDG